MQISRKGRLLFQLERIIKANEFSTLEEFDKCVEAFKAPTPGFTHIVVTPEAYKKYENLLGREDK